MNAHFLVLANTLGLMALCTILFSHAQRHIQNKNLRRLCVGVAFGAAGVIAMLQPLELAPGAFADARGAFVGMAMAFGGPVAAAVVVTMTATARLLIGGVGAPWGVMVIAATALLAGGWLYYFRDRERRDLRAWVTLTLACGLPTFLVLARVPGFGQRTEFFMAFLTAMLVFGFGKMLDSEQRRGRRERHLISAAETDALTALPNRRALDEYARQLEDSGAKDVMLLLLDVDHFKKINDEFGHDVGDSVLQDIALAIKSTIRAGDFAARIGGEEFAVIVRTKDVATGHQIAERFRRAVQVPYGDPSEGRVSTISVGGFCFSGKPFSYINGYKLADQALYQSKADGRNRATIAPGLWAA